jgi:ABC-type multidrug transport system permease subunit
MQPKGTYLAAKLATAMTFAAIVSLLLNSVAATAGGVVVAMVRWNVLFVLAMLGVIPSREPLSLLAHPLAQLAVLLPSWHLAQIARAVAGVEPSPAIAWHVLVLAAVAVACFAATRRALGRSR